MAAATIPRIKLRIDSNENWQHSLVPLYEGEIGIGYDLQHNNATGSDEKCNFHIKIGKKFESHPYCLWEYAEDLQVAELSPEAMATIVDDVLDAIGEDTFVSRQEYNEFKQTLERTVSAMSSRLSNRVKAYVDGSILVLSTED